MRISFQFNRKVRYDFEFGFNNSMWSSMYWFSIIKIYLDHQDNIEFAAMKFCWLKHPKFWFK